jgi:D-3-phosphoglycerate dehydrogenase
MISNITSIFGSAKINIEHLTNQSKKEMAYTVLDTNSEVTNELLGRIAATEGIIRVRKIEY